MTRRARRNDEYERHERSDEPRTHEQQQGGAGSAGFGPLHLAACLGAGVVAVLATNLIDWLT